jgi:hypothetical protein
MVSPDALPIVLGEDTMRPTAAGLGPAITLERGEDAGSFGHVAGRVLEAIIPTGSGRQHHLLASHRIMPAEESHLVRATTLPDAGQVLRSLLPACHVGECKRQNWPTKLDNDRPKIS